MSNADSKVERPLFVALFAGVGCFLLSFVAMGNRKLFTANF